MTKQSQKEYHAQWYQTNKEKVNKKTRKWQLSHLDRIRKLNHRLYLKRKAFLKKARQVQKEHPELFL